MLEVSGPDGRAAKLTPAGRKIRNDAASGISEKTYSISLEPGKIDANWPAFNMREFFVMHDAGKYVVHCIYQDHGVALKSNALTVQITPS